MHRIVINPRRNYFEYSGNSNLILINRALDELAKEEGAERANKEKQIKRVEEERKIEEEARVMEKVAQDREEEARERMIEEEARERERSK